MKVLEEKYGGCGTLTCASCQGKTGFLYVVENDSIISEICTSCKSVLDLIAEGKGDSIVRVWQLQTGKNFENGMEI